MRITRKVFTDLAIWMVCFGLTIGLIFPFFVILLGVPVPIALNYTFFAACLSAGVMAGGVNFWLARIVVGSRLKSLARMGERMRNLAATMRNAAPVGGDATQWMQDNSSICADNQCHVEVDSDDEIGESAEAFNLLAETLKETVTAERIAGAFSQLLSKQLDLEPLGDQALDYLLGVTGGNAGMVLIVQEGDLEVLSCKNISNPEQVSQSPYCSEALKTGKILHTAIPETVTVDHVVGQHRAAHVYVVPVLYKDSPLGVVVLSSEKSIQEEGRHRLEMLRTALSISLNNSLTHSRLRHLATLDPLTGIYNRGFGLGRLREEFKRSLRSESPLGILMFDIDHFKSINDAYGHLVGDRVITRIVKVTRSVLREGDMLVRYGGEEFLVILPAAARSDLLKIGERIRRIIQDMTVSEGEHLLQVTVSIGGVSWPEMDVEREEDLVKFADEALYRGKDMGRNRIEIYRAPSHASFAEIISAS